MSIYANVSKNALEDLSSGIVRFRSDLSAIHADVNMVINRYFDHFEAQKRRLQKLFDDSVNRVISAENELREARYKREPEKNADGKVDLVPVDLTPYYNKLASCKRAKEAYGQKLTTCQRIIEQCRYRKNMHNGTYNIIMQSIDKSISRLDQYINDVNQYHGYSRDYTTDIPKESSTEGVEPEKIVTFNNKTRLILYDNDGNPIVNGVVTIIDNNIFGFGRRELRTNEQGEVSTDYISSNDCSIYLDGCEIYTGNLFQTMEYNKYGDNRFVSTLNENNTSESQRIMFEESGYHQVRITHKIELDEYGEEIRREEAFVRDSDNRLEEVEITAKSDNLRSKSKDGWVKIIKQDGDDSL